MRWLLSLALVFAIPQIIACGSGSKGPQGGGDAASAPGTGGSAGAATNSYVDAARGGAPDAVDAAAASDAFKDASSSASSGNGGIPGDARAGDALGTSQGGRPIDAASDVGPPASGGMGGSTGGKGGGGGTSRATSTGSSRVDAAVITTGDAGGDTGGDRDGSPSDGGCANNSVCFVGGELQGLFSGVGWIDMAPNASLTDPTCGTDKHSITSDNPCTTRVNWNSETALCMTGAVTGLPATATAAEHEINWGVKIGVGLKGANDIGLAIAKYNQVAFRFSADAKIASRAVLHRKGDPDTTTYCIDDIRSGAALRLDRFNTKCWGDVTTVYLELQDIPKIDYFALRLVPFDETRVFSNLCLQGLSFQ